MTWVIVFAAIAAAGVIMVVGYTIWLAHKASDVFAELKVLADRGGQLVAVLDEVKIPERLGESTPARNRIDFRYDDVG